MSIDEKKLDAEIQRVEEDLAYEMRPGPKNRTRISALNKELYALLKNKPGTPAQKWEKAKREIQEMAGGAKEEKPKRLARTKQLFNVALTMINSELGSEYWVAFRTEKDNHDIVSSKLFPGKDYRFGIKYDKTVMNEYDKRIKNGSLVEKSGIMAEDPPQVIFEKVEEVFLKEGEEAMDDYIEMKSSL